ncbi:hypothetical protein [Brucella intermedia]|uniref:hypothetical protein n=1 Tax=Brucella intermedia TaxID=94625 RepID=UPI00244964CF|nr:hypothetical protein [Brucella intermedia]WGG61825.1 hypothetical protein QA414_14995 [Brucella intermedia]
MTTVPEEAVKAMPERIYAKVHGASTDVISGQRGLIGGWNEHQRDGQAEYVRADLAFLSVQGAVTALKWHQEDNGDFIAESVVGWYHIGLPHRMWNLTKPNGEVLSFWTLDETKAAAQADYEARILSALEPSAARELALEEGYRQGVEAAAQKAAEMLVFADTTSTADREIPAAIRSLSSQDHADAGKVEGDGWMQKASELYDRCKLWPERSAEGFTALLDLRNHVAEILPTPAASEGAE